MTPNPNSHIEEYFAYYISLRQPPGFAVLVNGEWGIGKSTLVKRLLAKHFPVSTISHEKTSRAPSYIYVSLFGVRSVEEINAAVLHAAYPMLATKAAEIVRGVSGGLFKKFVGDSQLSAAHFLKEPDADLFVFDDLERCELSLDGALGYINRFVEHRGRKVIIIAHEGEIQESNYRKRREKLIGQVLQLNPMIDEALQSFVDKLGHVEARKFLQSKVGDMKRVVEQSGSQNLRVLQQSIWIFERLYSVISPSYRKNDEAMTTLLRILLVFSIEVKAARILATDLVDRESRLVRQALRSLGDEKSHPLDATLNRYPNVPLHDGILTDEILVEVFDRGVFDAVKIDSALQQSVYFLEAGSEPCWRTLWYGFDRSDADVQTAVTELEKEFADRKFVKPGVLLHVFGIRLWLSDTKVMHQTRAEVVAECKRYVDDIYVADTLIPLPFVPAYEDTDSGHDGLGFREVDTKEFREIAQYFSDRRAEARTSKLPLLGRQLLQEMEENPQLFRERLVASNSDVGTYARVAVLQTIDAREFVRKLLVLTPPEQRRLFLAIRSRYDAGELDRELAEEKEWLKVVRQELAEQTTSLSAWQRYRIHQLAFVNIDRILASPPKPAGTSS